MRQAARLNQNYPAIITEDRAFTFAQAWERGVWLANGLEAMGLQPGDRVAGLEENNLGCADFYLGCAIAGAVRVPLYPRDLNTVTAEELIDACRARLGSYKKPSRRIQFTTDPLPKSVVGKPLRKQLGSPTGPAMTAAFPERDQLTAERTRA